MRNILLAAVAILALTGPVWGQSKPGPGVSPSDLPALATTAPDCGTGSIGARQACTGTLVLPSGSSAAGMFSAAGDLGSAASALIDGASIATNCNAGNMFTVTLGGNRTLANPSNCVAGHTYSWKITQGSGGQTLTYGSAFIFLQPYSSAAPPILSTGANAVDLLSCVYDGAYMVCAFGQGAS